MHPGAWVQVLYTGLMLCGLSFWVSIVFSSQTPVRLSEGWRWLDWRPLPHDTGRVVLQGFLFSFFLQALVFGVFPEIKTAPAFVQVALMLSVYQGVIVYMIYHHFHRVRVPESEALGMGGWRLHDATWGLVGYCMVLPLVWLAMLLTEGAFDALGWEWKPQQMVQWIQVESSAGQSLALLALIGFVGPFLEEVIFRGAVFPLFCRKFGSLPGLLLQGVLFSVIHLHLGSLVPLFLLGVLLGLVYLYTQRLMACVWTHVFFNSMTLLYTLPLFAGGQG
jgi:membrane protease YdiL (CAAX protease family)